MKQSFSETLAERQEYLDKLKQHGDTYALGSNIQSRLLVILHRKDSNHESLHYNTKENWLGFGLACQCCNGTRLVMAGDTSLAPLNSVIERRLWSLPYGRGLFSFDALYGAYIER